MTSFRRLPVVVEAVHWTGDNWQEVADTFGGAREVMHDISSYRLIVNTIEGQKICRSGDWVVQNGESFDVMGNPEFLAAHKEVAEFASETLREGWWPVVE